MKQLIFTFFLSIFLILPSLKGQNVIQPAQGYSPQIGTIVSMLEDLKERISSSVKKLNQEETDFLLDQEANRIGALILHLAATEKYYQLYTFENRGFNESEEVLWGTALNLGDQARETFVDQPISYYLNIWDDVRKETRRLLKSKDDKWFAAKVRGSSMNNHWAWYHVMEHQANHMGQIRFLIKRI